MKKRAVVCLVAGVIVSSSRVVHPQTDFAVIPNPGCTTTGAVMCGLDNPRGLAFDASGALYVAEAGRGNASRSEPVVLRDDLHPATALAQNCISDRAPYSCGPTGALTRLQAGIQERIATGLPSGIALQNPGAGNVKLGPNAVSWLGVGRPSRRRPYVPIGLWDDPNDRAGNYPSPPAT